MNETTILVVEDEPLVGLEIQDDLIHLGYRVPEVVTRGEDVQKAIDRHHPALVLMDIRLAGTMDGIDAAEELRRSSDVPVLFLTAYSDSETVGRAAQVLPEGYLLKPFGERDLAASIELALHKATAPLQQKKALSRMVPLIDALPQGLVLFDSQGLWFHGNPTACTALEVKSGAGPDLPSLVGQDAQGWPGHHPGLINLRLSITVEVLPAVAGQPGGFLGTLERRDRVHRTDVDPSSRAINRTLVDLLPKNGLYAPRVESAGFLIPSDEGSGDFYDLFPLGPHHFVFYNVDVEGHGPVPAMVVYSLRAAIRDLAGTYLTWHDEIPSPGILLEALNEKFDHRDEGSLFFTITLGIVSPMTGEFELGRAGHTRTLWLRADGSMDWLTGEGSALGALPEVAFEVQTGRLQAGDRLVLCSDGLLEALGNRDLDRGYSALAELIEGQAGHGLEAVVRTIKRASVGARPDHSDDMSLLAICPRLW